MQVGVPLARVDLGPAKLGAQTVGVELNEDQLRLGLEVSICRVDDLGRGRAMNEAFAV